MSIPVPDIRPYPADRTMSSPNHGQRRGQNIKLIVLHATAGSDLGAEAWMTSSRSQVSAHLHIRRDGTVTRLVPDTRRAWHAGASSWPGVDDVNSDSLGWEIGNDNRGEPYTDEQYETVANLLRHYLPQGLGRNDVVSHAQIAPGRKTDPVGWDWGRMWRLVDGDPLADLDLEVPELEMVDSTWEPMPLPEIEPVAALRSPARAVVAATAEKDEPLRDWMCRITGWVMDEQALTGRLPWWLPPSLARRALRHVFGCA